MRTDNQINNQFDNPATGAKRIRPIWLDPASERVQVIDQRYLPHQMDIITLHTVDETISAIKTMVVRGAPLIGVTAAWGMYLGSLNAPDRSPDDAWLQQCAERIKGARPTAVNLAWAVDQVLEKLLAITDPQQRVIASRQAAAAIADAEAENCRLIGQHGLPLIERISAAKHGKPVNILTHCNAGWLACVEYGTATAPVYAAHDAGIAVHVWVDETRPLNQGARLTAWELGRAGINHTVICDNAGGHLMQHQLVDMVIVGTDRTTCTGDVANKIGTYLKALAARDNNVPFYVALPSSTFDWQLRDGLNEIPIEARHDAEIHYVQGHDGQQLQRVRITPPHSPAANPAFDVTPARLVTGFITERGLCGASEAEIKARFPEK